MEKSIKLFIDTQYGEKRGFPVGEKQVEISAFNADYKRMGGAPTITCTVKYHQCLDDLWTYGVYTEFNNERFYLKQIPSSSYSNKDARYVHEIELCSERIQLDNVFVFDVAGTDVDVDRPVSNNTNFSFFGDIVEFAKRLNNSLIYTNLQSVNSSGAFLSGYRVIVDEGVSSEGQLVTVENKVFSEVLQEAFNVYKIPYYFVGKDIHLGYSMNALNETFRYGASDSLLSIKKQNANAKVINRITGFGSEENIPYYYPNLSPLGDVSILYNDKLGLAQISNKELFNKKNNLSTVYTYSSSPGFVKFPEQRLEIISGPTHSHDEYYWPYDYYHLRIHFFIERPPNRIATLEIRHRAGSTKEPVVKLYRYDTLVAELPNKQAGDAWNPAWDAKIVLHNFEQGEYYLDIEDRFRRPLSDVELSVTPSITYSMEDSSCWLSDGRKIVDLKPYGIKLLAEPQDGDVISIRRGEDSWIVPQKKLMPSIYRDTLGKERFYNALNDTYKKEGTSENYSFTNEYVAGNPREHIAEFPDIKPTIVGVTNAAGETINSFIDFAYDEHDNDEKDEEGNYKHPYFFAKLRRFSGEFGFNLFANASESGAMLISMTNGSCGACQWEIGVDSETKENLVQVDENGDLLRDDNGNVICGREGVERRPAQSFQQNTLNNEVWIALKKDITTFHTIMPNATNNYRPSIGDTFVILNINLPHAYILAAEKRLDEELIRFMSENNDEKFNFSVDFSKVFFAQNETVLESLNENSRINIEYNNRTYLLYVNSFSYSIKENSSLPDIKVELSQDVTVASNAIKQAVTQVEAKFANQLASLDIQTLAAPYFHRKDITDQTAVSQTFTDGIKVGENKEYGFNKQGVVKGEEFRTKDFQAGFAGAAIYREGYNTVAEVDMLKVRKKATFKEVEIQETKHIGGKLELTAAECKCARVEPIRDELFETVAFKVYFQRFGPNNESITNKWQIGDQARCDTFNIEQNKDGSFGNRYYWRLVTDVGTGGFSSENESMDDFHWIVLSNRLTEDLEFNGVVISDTTGYDFGSSEPLEGDTIIQLGNRFGTDGRTAAIELAGAGADSPYIRQYENITTFALGDAKTQIKPGDNKFKGMVSIEDGSYGIGKFTDLPDEVNKAVQVGAENLLRNTGFDGEHESKQMDSYTDVSIEQSLYSENLEFWGSNIEGVESVKLEASKSGYACQLNVDGARIFQQVELIEGEQYVLSFMCDGKVTAYYGDQNGNFGNGATPVNCKFTFVGSSSKTEIAFVGRRVKTRIWHVKLERGTIQTDWCPALADNDPVADLFKDLWYLQSALKGKTEILGGLILSSILQLGNYRNGSMERVTAGVSGVTSNPEIDVAFWGGGTLQEAIKAVKMFKDNPSYQPTQEEVAGIAKAVITHGGRAILNDIVLRGYIYALGGVFNGTVYASDGVFKGDVIARRNIITRPTEDELEYQTITVTKPSLNGSTSTSTKYLVVKNAYIAGTGNYLLPDLEEGQMVKIIWFNPPYVLTVGVSRFKVLNSNTAGVGVKNTSTNKLAFSGELYITASKTLYTIIGDRPIGSDFTYWSLIEAGENVNTTTSGVDTDSSNLGYDTPILPGTGGWGDTLEPAG